MCGRDRSWTLAVLLLLCGCAGAAADDHPATTYPLPDDPETIVLELALDDSAGAAPASPAVQIRADGRVVVPAGSGSGRALYGELTADQLQLLLREIVETQQFLECDSDDVAAAIEQAGRRSGRDWRIQNAAATVIRLRLKDTEHEVRCNAAELLLERFPEVDGLARLCAVQRRLQNVRALVEVGGEEEGQRLAALATDELRQGAATGPEVTSRDLLHVRSSGDGLRQVQFRMESVPENGGEAEIIMITIFESPEAPPRVSVTTLPARQ
jgi:hypothetical protein